MQHLVQFVFDPAAYYFKSKYMNSHIHYSALISLHLHLPNFLLNRMFPIKTPHSFQSENAASSFFQEETVQIMVSISSLNSSILN